MAVLRTAFWNVENLFAPGLVDRGPQTEEELEGKLSVLARTINGFFRRAGPDLLGLAEVGDEIILSRLQTRLRPDYHRVWAGARVPEQTGLALLARTNVVSELVSLDEQRPTMMTRPRVIVVRCKLFGVEEPVLVAVNHWKSRLRHGDGVDDRMDRLETARWLGDYLARSTRETCVIVLGDFNAEPFEVPFSEVGLRGVRHFSTALWAGATPAYLYNAVWRFLPEPSHWERAQASQYQEPRPKTSHDSSPPVLFDHLLVSGRALRNGPIALREATVRYYWSQVTAQRNRRGVLRPRPWVWRNAGDFEGASDHFPVLATFDINR